MPLSDTAPSIRNLAISVVLLAACLSSSDSSGDGAGTDMAGDSADAPSDDITSSGDGASSDRADAQVDDRDSRSDTGQSDSDSPRECTPREAVVPTTDFFTDISNASGIRLNNYDEHPPASVPINDHSRLTFADLDGDGFEDMVMHSLFPNPQAGIPFEHLVFLNNGDTTFRDHSAASGLKDVQAGFFAFGDVDNDGDLDAFAGLDIPLSGQTHAVLLNDGDGVFSPVVSPGFDAMPAYAANAVFFDYDGDGVLDLFVGIGGTTAAGPDWLFRGNADGTFQSTTALLASNPQHPTNGSVTCDYDNDGDSDIIVSTYSVSTNLGLNILWQNNGGAFENVAVERGFASLPGGNYWLSQTGYGLDPEPGKEPGTYVGSNGFGLDCGDVDNDGLMDIFLTTISHPGGDYNRTWSDPSQLLVNRGESEGYAFTNVFLDRGLPYNEGDVDGAMIDFDNDGLLDLSFSRENKYEGGYDDDAQKGWFGLMRQRADGNFDSMGLESGINALDAENSATLTSCSGDGECSGIERCLAERCRIPCTTTTDCPTEQEVCHTGGFCRLLGTMKRAQNHAWADIDRDGDLDLLVGGRDMGGGRPNYLFRNDLGSSNRWLALRLVGDGVNINRDAIGARAQIVFADETLTREVRSSRGMYNSGDGRALLFGLGGRSCDYEVRIRWPDGTAVTLPANQAPEERYLTVTYPSQVEVD